MNLKSIGPRECMFEYKFHSWKNATPGEVLEDIEAAICVFELVRHVSSLAGKKKTPRKQVDGLLKNIQAMIRKGYEKFEERWPGWLTPERAVHFKKYLA